MRRQEGSVVTRDLPHTWGDRPFITGRRPGIKWWSTVNLNNKIHAHINKDIFTNV